MSAPAGNAVEAITVTGSKAADEGSITNNQVFGRRRGRHRQLHKEFW